jgi:hypothetical protein
MKLRARRYDITSYKQLAAALDGRRLHKTCGGPSGPSFTILPGGLRCDPKVVGEAVARGWLDPVDPGLFGSTATAQSWSLRSFGEDKESFQ